MINKKTFVLERSDLMCRLKKLPDSELEIMQAVWSYSSPVTSAMVLKQLPDEKHYLTQTVNTLLNRLTKRGFLHCEKDGRHCLYHPLVTKEEYLQYETNRFLKKLHGNSVSSLVATLYKGNQISDDDVKELEAWLHEKGNPK